jgi:bacterioferritin-associated ferredoxin
MLCYCSQVTAADFCSYASNRSFEQALETSGVGARCTACLLDAEYLFVNTSHTQNAQRPVAAALGRDLSWRRRLWKILDSVAPMSPFPLGEFSPILRGKNVETSIVVPPRNSRLFELQLRDNTDEGGSPCQAFLRWNCSGMHKAHVICASNALDQFSIDHP